MHFDKTVNLGHILILVGVVFSGIAAYAGARVTLNEHDMRIRTVEETTKAQWNQITAIQTSIWLMQADVAVIKDRMGPRPLK